ncbi:MAG: CsgG/HfaB family protein, partial [Oleiphilaceae bacterium]|nr:CsgG/HfaB family protein [Oleiphilaceae bacterium]
MILLLVVWLSGCSSVGTSNNPYFESVDGPTLTPASDTFFDLIRLPPPAGRISVAIYRFPDQTGQFREAGQSSFSTAVTQGSGALLTTALLDSGWFRPLEREGLQDLLTERRIIRQIRDDVPNLRQASLMLDGGIIAYETNTATGGVGARYFGLGVSEQYRVDQVTVNLRAIDVNSGEILVSVLTTKTIFSQKMEGDLFRFVRNQRLLEAEAGYSINEPRYLAANDAISAAVVHLVVQGVEQNLWRLGNEEDRLHPVISAYRSAYQDR